MAKCSLLALVFAPEAAPTHHPVHCREHQESGTKAGSGARYSSSPGAGLVGGAQGLESPADSLARSYASSHRAGSEDLNHPAFRCASPCQLGGRELRPWVLLPDPAAPFEMQACRWRTRVRRVRPDTRRDRPGCPRGDVRPSYQQRGQRQPQQDATEPGRFQRRLLDAVQHDQQLQPGRHRQL